MKIILLRLNCSEIQNLGVLQVFEDTEKLFECKTLELPWMNNKQNKSCIPLGKYKIKKWKSEQFGNVFYVTEQSGVDVTNRTGILIHCGNYKKNTKGCILVGRHHTDIDKNGIRDVTHSKDTLKILYGILPEICELEIY